jgi:hypothetical protein
VNGWAHYAEAETCVAQSHELRGAGDTEGARDLLIEAQVNATLALAAATVQVASSSPSTIAAKWHSVGAL